MNLLNAKSATSPTPIHPSTWLSSLRLRPMPLSLAVASLVTLAALGFYASRSVAADAAKPEGPAKAALTVSITAAKAGMLPIKQSANGSIAAWQDIVVGAETNGLRVLELKAQVGDVVKRGQVLATFAAESVQADVAMSRAAVAEASANALEAIANADRARAVQSTGALSAQQVSQYLTAELTAKARVESAKAQLDTQLLRLKNTQLLAPDSGVVSARAATVGSVVGAGSEMFRIIRQGRLEWRGEVTSAELGRVTTGTTVVLTAPGGSTAKGRVRMVAPTVDPQTRSGLVYVDVVSKDARTAASFKPGMFARGEFELGSSGALTVPRSAVVVRDGFSYVYRVAADNRVTQLKVQTGRLVGDVIEIQSGLKADEKVVASGGSFLSDGDLVKVVNGPSDSKPNSAVAPAVPAQAATK
jgi:HlyD family secretion protein